MTAPTTETPRLGVNVDHVATLRNARGGGFPSPVDAARVALAAGADGITLHLREDRRHVRDGDLADMLAAILAPVNLEMAATPEMVAIAVAARPHACCLVPESRRELTTEGGLDVARDPRRLRADVAALRGAGCRVSLFVDPDPVQLDAAAAIGADIVELHTGRYAHHGAGGAGAAGELDRLRAAAARAAALGLECHAGHGLTYANVAAVAAIPELRELNIGHFIVGQAVFDGLPAVVAAMRRLMDGARRTV